MDSMSTHSRKLTIENWFELNHFDDKCFPFSLDNKSAGRQSVASNLKPDHEDDADSMAEYGEGDTGIFCFAFQF